MGYRPFHLSRTGAAHIRRELTCQDASASEVYKNAHIAVVADGHGSRRHFRSDRGSAIACRIALVEIRTFLDNGEQDERPMDNRLTALKQAICDAWIAAVREDYAVEPWTEDELNEERKILTEEQFGALIDGSDVPVAYGSTLCAVVTHDGGWAAIQLGDGCFVRVGTDGIYDWPMPESMVNEGNRTASLCMWEPMRDFRHCWGTDHPAGLLVYTDGIEKTFPAQGKEVTSLLHWIWRNEYRGAAEREDNLARTLDMLTQRSVIGDDVSVAGIVDTEAEDKEPIHSPTQLRKELDRLAAQIEEIEGTIRYNEERIRAVCKDDEDTRPSATEQLRNVIERKQTIAAELRERAARIRIELGEPEPELEIGPESAAEDELEWEWDLKPAEKPETDSISAGPDNEASEQDKRRRPMEVVRRFLRGARE